MPRQAAVETETRRRVVEVEDRARQAENRAREAHHEALTALSQRHAAEATATLTQYQRELDHTTQLLHRQARDFEADTHALRDQVARARSVVAALAQQLQARIAWDGCWCWCWCWC